MARYILLLMLAMTTALLRGAEVISCKPGPWGRIEYETIYLQAPDWVLDRFSMPGTQPRWSFPGATAEAVQALFARWTFDPAALKRWFEPGNCRQDEEAFTIYPTPEEVIALPAATRAALYRDAGLDFAAQAASYAARLRTDTP